MQTFKEFNENRLLKTYLFHLPVPKVYHCQNLSYLTLLPYPTHNFFSFGYAIFDFYPW